MITICLDAGHGKNTVGKRCLKSIDPNETREWVLNSRIALLVEKRLKDYDCKVYRVDDITGINDVALSTRVKMSNNANANVYISIHHNAGVNGGDGGGITVYYYSSKTERLTQAKKLYDCLIEKTGLKGNRATPVKKYPFYVVKKTNAPAFLIENGFMDSLTDVPIILTDDHATKTADAIVDFLVSCFNLSERSETVETPSKVSESERYEEIGRLLDKIMKDLDDNESMERLFSLL